MICGCDIFGSGKLKGQIVFDKCNIIRQIETSVEFRPNFAVVHSSLVFIYENPFLDYIATFLMAKFRAAKFHFNIFTVQMLRYLKTYTQIQSLMICLGILTKKCNCNS